MSAPTDNDNHRWHRDNRSGPYGRLQRDENYGRHKERHRDIEQALNPAKMGLTLKDIRKSEWSKPLPDMETVIAQKFQKHGRKSFLQRALDRVGK